MVLRQIKGLGWYKRNEWNPQKNSTSLKVFLTYRITNEVHGKFKFEINVGSGPHSHISIYWDYKSEHLVKVDLRDDGTAAK